MKSPIRDGPAIFLSYQMLEKNERKESMTKLEQDQVLQWAILEYGPAAQITMAVEECAELINVLCKECRKRVNAHDIITEIADVTIMMRQLARMYGENSVENEIDYKMNRLKERLEKNERKGFSNHTSALG